MKKLYFVFPDIATACQRVTQLENAGVPLYHLHAVARPDTVIPCVHPANLLHTTQTRRGIFMGLMVGGTAGLFGGWLAILFPPPSFAIGNDILMISTILGGALGAMIGASLTQDRLNPEILPYEGAILQGAILLIVQLPPDEVDKITDLINHPPA